MFFHYRIRRKSTNRGNNYFHFLLKLNIIIRKVVYVNMRNRYCVCVRVCCVYIFAKIHSLHQNHPLFLTLFSNNFSSPSPNRFSNNESAFKYTLLPDLATISAISRAASILRNFINPGFFLTARPISSADSASPLALVIMVFFSC